MYRLAMDTMFVISVTRWLAIVECCCSIDAYFFKTDLSTNHRIKNILKYNYQPLFRPGAFSYFCNEAGFTVTIACHPLAVSLM